MNDRYHSLGEQESPEYFMLHQSASSPTSASSASSPMTSAVSKVSAGSNWQSIAFPFDHHDLQHQQVPWATTHPQQHQGTFFQQHNHQYQLQLQQQLQYQQQHEIWNMQNSTLYHNNPPPSQFQFPNLPAEDVHYFAHPQQDIPHSIDIRNIPNQPLQDTYLVNTAEGPRALASTSPNVTPLPSPVLPSSSKRKGDKKASSSQMGETLVKENADERGGKRKRPEEEDGARVKLKGNLKTVDHLERELSYLGGECATILIMLDSLRNAFLADIPTTSSQQRPAPTLPSISSFDSRNVSYATITANHAPPVIDARRPSKIIAQNPEMEREMRTAYDDLWLQTRQLEKKVEVLEVKSKSATVTEKKKKKNKAVDEEVADMSSPTSDVPSSVLSEEEFDQDDDDYLLESRSKSKCL